MDAVDLRGKAAKEGIPTALIEKDYVLSVVLYELSKSRIRQGLVFKGGTAIKKIYFPNARFSEDLDFAVFNLDKKEIVEELRALFGNKEIQSVRFIGLEEEKTSAGLRLSLKFVSFLGQPQRIRFDFSFRHNLVLEPVEKEVVDSYSLGKAIVRVLHPEELFAEKIHAVMSRTVARDLYDIWFLLNNGAKTNYELVKKKFEYYNERFEFEKLVAKISDFKVKWHQDLRQLLKQVPEFDQVSKEVLARMGNLTP
jgi:predicted nucleotidyltransferase component of viral defense system